MTDFVEEPARKVPVVETCDICVIGGSTTGVFAGVAAARAGARVALVEAQGCLGGTATAGLVCIWHTRLDTRLEEVIIGGLPIELMDRLKRRGALDDGHPSTYRHYVFLPSEMTIELDEMIGESKIRPFLHARFVAPVMKGDGEVDAVVIEDKSGRRAIRASRFVDATGDADLVHRMGLECYRGAKLQPPTTCALIQGLEELATRNPGFNLKKAVFDRRHPEALPKGFLWTAAPPGLRDITMVAGTRVHGADLSDADELTRAEIEGRRQVRSMCDLLRRHFEGGERIGLVALPAHIGIRQTRQARCVHTLTQEEVLTGRRFPDAIANGSYPVDIHSADGDGLTFRYLDGREVVPSADGTSRQGRWRPSLPENPTFYQVPYGSLVPRGARNVLVSGRGIDADEGAFGAIRVMINTSQLGEAAGTAAWLSLDSGNPVAEVDTDALRKTLKDAGAVVI